MTIFIVNDNCVSLVKQLTLHMRVPVICYTTQKFEDGEFAVNIHGDVCNEDVVILQFAFSSAHDDLMELILVADQSKKRGAQRIVAMIPYIRYSRQDRGIGGKDCGLQTVAAILETAGVDHIFTVDIHSPQSLSFFKIQVQNLNTTPIIEHTVRREYDITSSHFAVVAPDMGGVARATALCVALGCSLVVLCKYKKVDGTYQLSYVTGDAKNKHCIIVDDIVSTGQTLLNAAHLLTHERGAAKVSAYATHCVANTQRCIELALSPLLQKIYVTDSVLRHVKLPAKFSVISIISLIKIALASVTSNSDNNRK